MKRRDSAGVFINILILIIAILVTILFLVDYINKQNIETGTLISAASNVTISSITAERTDDIEERAKRNIEKNSSGSNIVLPTIEEPTGKKSSSDASTSESNFYQYYYYQLDSNAKEIYQAIEKNIEKIKTGTYTIEIPSSVGKVLDQENGEEILNQEFQSAWDAIIMDRVELFYIDVSKVSLEMRTTSYGRVVSHKLTMKPNVDTYLEDDFSNKQLVDTAINQVENMRDQIIANLSGNDYEKIVQVNDFLVDYLEYSADNGNNAYNIYGALIQKRCVCEGYAESFKYIMDALNIPCILVIGTAQNSEGNTENHEWNYVQLDNTWYAVDATWNDPIIVGGGKLTNSLKRKYLLNGDSINSNHLPNGKISSSGITFAYPALSTKNYK